MAPRPATEEMAALAVETSDATTTEAEAAPQAPQGRSRGLKLAGAAGAAALAAGAVAAVVAGRAAPFPSLLQQAGGGGVTALQQSRNFQVGVGCTNWKMKLQEATLCSADECWDLCVQTAGCKAMNFQGMENEFCGAGGGKKEGTCYLYGQDCQETDNACWTLGIMPATGSPGGGPDTAGDKVAVNFKLAGLNFASFSKDPDAYRAIFNGVKEVLAKYTQVQPNEVHLALTPAPDGSVAVTATFLNPGVQVNSVNAFLPQAGQEIVNALASNAVLMKYAPGNLQIEDASVGMAPASAGGSLKPQEPLPPAATAQPTPTLGPVVTPQPTVPPTISKPPLVASTTTADNSFDETTV